MSAQTRQQSEPHSATMAGRGRRRRRRWLFWGAFLIVAIVAWRFFAAPAPTVPGTVVVVELGAEMRTTPPSQLQAFLGAPELSLLSLHEALDAAGKDEHVDAVLLKIGAHRVGRGVAEEIRGLVAALRSSGKRTIAFLSQPDSESYLIASAADEVILERAALFDVRGIRLSSMFLGKTLARYGVEADFVRVGSFKGAYEQLVRSTPTPEFEAAMESLVDSLYESLIRAIASSRERQQDAIGSAIDAAPLTPQEAIAQGLVDHVLFEDELKAHIDKTLGRSELHFESAQSFLSRWHRAVDRDRASIALIALEGTIVDGDSGRLSLVGNVSGADTIVDAIRSAEEDDAVSAIVLYINSPGGGVGASERIWRAVTQAHKPVAAYIAGVGASGGYYAAAAADVIFAQEMSLTGSIGIFGGKFVAAELLDSQEVGVHTYSRGARASMFDLSRRFNADEKTALARTMQKSYDTFVERVTRGRRLERSEVERAADGRVWSGVQARTLGLVDHIGGLADAIGELEERAGVSDTTLVVYPKPPGLLAPFVQHRERLVHNGNQAGAAMRAGDLARTLIEELSWLSDARGVALMPHFLEVR